jgi:hypothetical protein
MPDLQPWRLLDVLEVHRVVEVGDILTTVTILFAMVGGFVSLRRFRHTLRQAAQAQQAAHYSELDRLYADILRAGIETPHLRMPAAIKTDDDAFKRDYLPFPDGDRVKRAQYDTYAYMVWNFLETVHDRCVENPGLIRTWAPVIRVEDSLHRGWFLAEMRKEALRRHAHGPYCNDTHKFCEEFRMFVVERQWDETDWVYRDEWRTQPDFGI